MRAVVTLLATKGGVGKTTTAVNLAREMTRYAPVLLVDCDPQDAGSSTRWLDDPDAPVNVVKVRDVTALQRLVEAMPGVLIIDTPRSDDPVTKAALALSTLVLCPCGTSQAEVLAARQSTRLIPPAVAYRVVLTRVDGRMTKLQQDATRALDALNIPRLQSAIRLRAAHIHAQDQQAAVIDLREPHTGTRHAAEDFTRLTEELVPLLATDRLARVAAAVGTPQ
jgi:chromosome partitioning protein